MSRSESKDSAGFHQQTVERKSAVYAAVLALACAAGTEFISPESQADFYFALLTALVTYIFFEQVGRKHQLLELKERLGVLQITGEETLNHKGSLLEMAEKLASLQDCDSVIQKTGYSAIRHAITDVTVSQSGEIFIKGRDSAFLAYSRFWQQISKDTTSLEDSCLGAYITHTSDVDKWNERKSGEIRTAQAAYARIAGVFRVFVNRQPTEPAHLQKYLDVMKGMKREGILCVYAHKSQLEDLDADCLDTDFCIVDAGAYTAEWTLSHSGRVSGFRLTDDKTTFAKNKRSWMEIMRLIETLSYDSHSIPTEFAEEFNDFRLSFIYAHEQLGRRKRAMKPGQSQLGLDGAS
jgi:hypothetical protein